MLIVQEIFGYFFIGLVGMAGMAVVYLPIYFLLRNRMPLSRQLVYFLFVACVLIILTATVFDSLVVNLVGGRGILAQEHTCNLIPFHFLTQTWLMGSRKKITQVIANMLMFVPPGFLVPVTFPRMRKWWRTTVCMMLFSFGIEFVQYFIGRAADIDDLMLNTLGGLLGYFIFHALWGWAQNKKLRKKIRERGE